MFLVDDYCLTGVPEDGGLTLAIKRYRPKSRLKSKDTVQLALIFIHGVGTRTSHDLLFSQTKYG